MKEWSFFLFVSRTCEMYCKCLWLHALIELSLTICVHQEEFEQLQEEDLKTSILQLSSAALKQGEPQM